MSKNVLDQPDQFSMSPLLAILPDKGSLERLEGLTTSLYARYEKVSHLLRDIQESSAGDMRKRLVAEQVMLKLVLDWLEVGTESIEGS